MDDWFAGYDAGLSSGSNSGVSRFHEIYLRRGGCNSGWANGYADDSVNLQNYGQPDVTGTMQYPMTPGVEGMAVPTPNGYGVSNFPGVPDPYGVQTN